MAGAYSNGTRIGELGGQIGHLGGSPAEQADRDDCLAGVEALACVVEDLAAGD